MTDTNPPADRTAAKCDCFWTDPSTWTTHYGAAEPGSQREWNPECPEHGQATEIRSRLKAATPGPWEHNNSAGIVTASGDFVTRGDSNGYGCVYISDSDAALMANAPTDLAHLLGRVEELERQLATARALHQPAIGGVQVGRMQIKQITACERCQVMWPCEDAKALGLSEDPTTAPDSEMDPFEAADDTYRRCGS